MGGARAIHYMVGRSMPPPPPPVREIISPPRIAAVLKPASDILRSQASRNYQQAQNFILESRNSLLKQQRVQRPK
jgi:hypothetical protein|eukprot:3998568-Prymnesium_polylepis.3